MPSATGPQILTSQNIDQDGRMSKKPRANKLYEKIRQMRKDPTIYIARAMALAPMLLAPWSVEKENDAPPGAAEEVAKVFLPMRTHLLRTGGNGCIDFGWQPYEKVITINDEGRTRIKFKQLLQDITDILVTEDGDYDGLIQTNTRVNGDTEDIELTVGETLLLNFDVEGTDWYGQSLMEIAQKPYDKWETTEEGASRYDRKLAGSHWVIYYPLGVSWYNGVADVDNLVIATAIMRSLESSGIIAVPSTLDATLDDLNRQLQAAKAPWRIELLTENGGHVAYLDRQKYFDALKVRAFGMPERSILEGTYGTKAEAETHGDLAVTLMECRHQTLVQQINWHGVNHFLRLNYGNGTDDSVYISPGKLTDTAVAFLREVFKTFLSDPTNGIMMMERIDQEALMDRLSIPAKPSIDIDEPGVIAPEAGDPGTDTGDDEWPIAPGLT